MGSSWVIIVIVVSLYTHYSNDEPSYSATDNFTFSSLNVDYALSADSSGHSRLDVTEAFVAEFPDYAQNKGIIRAIPSTYDGHSLRITVKDVRDSNGDAVPYWVEHHKGFTEVYTGNDDYVMGTQSYVIHYTARDVIHRPAFGSAQQFYWNVNGTGWNQPFGDVTAKITLPAKLAGALTGDTTCYQGKQGSKASCTIDSSGDSITASSGRLGAHENMSVVVGFAPGTFVVPGSIPRQLVWVLLGLAVAVLIAAIIVRIVRLGPPRGTGIIIAQHERYPGIGVMEAAELLDKSDLAFPALLTELVVSRAAVMTKTEGAHSHEVLYTLQLADATVLDDEDGAAVHILFDSLKPGAHVRLDTNDRRVGDRVKKLLEAAKKSVHEQGLVAPRVTRSSAALLFASAGLAVAGFALGAVLVVGHLGGGVSYAALGVALAAAIAGVAVASPPDRPTAEAMPAYEHLLGIREYLTVAEADRIRMLQSPSGAETTPAPSGGEVVKLYERLLPYAVLFDIEQEWRDVLGGQYASTPTDLTSTLTDYSVTSSLSHSFASSAFASGSSSWSGGGGGGGGGGGSGGGGGGGGGGGR